MAVHLRYNRSDHGGGLVNRLQNANPHRMPYFKAAILSIGLTVPAVCSGQTRIDSISNPGLVGPTNPQVGAHNVGMHFSTLLIIGVVVPLWGIFAIMLVREAFSWFDRIVSIKGGIS